MTVDRRTGVPPARSGIFAALRIRNFRLFMIGQSISVGGNWMQNVAVGWLVLQLTDNGSILGIVTAARYLPILLLGPWGGLVADRHNKRKLLGLTAATQLAVSGVIGVLTITHTIAVWSLILLILAFGSVDIIDTPTRQAFTNELVDREHVANAIALNSVLTNVARIAGPGAAGFVIVTLGVGPCFLANAATYAAVIVGLQLMRSHELWPARSEVRGTGQIRAGLRYVAATPKLLTAVCLVLIAGMFAWEFQVTVPLFVSKTFHGGSTQYGAALACLAAGSIVGGIVAARRRHTTSRTLAVAAIGWGSVIIVAAAAPTLPVAYALFAFVGATAVTFNSSSKTLLQTEAVENMRGRVMSLWSVSWQGTTVIGAPIVGFVGQEFGARLALGIGGISTLLAGLGVLLAVLPRSRWSDSM